MQRDHFIRQRSERGVHDIHQGYGVRPRRLGRVFFFERHRQRNEVVRMLVQSVDVPFRLQEGVDPFRQLGRGLAHRIFG